jgi:lysophospholipase L1-like esterase
VLFTRSRKVRQLDPAADGDVAADLAVQDDPVAAGPVMPWRRYVALGDSFTEGLWDIPGHAPPASAEQADPALRCRGWADLLAAHLAERTGERVLYANHAIRGRLLGPILRDQVPAALELGPDLVSLVGGGNDLLRPGADPDSMAAGLEDAVVRLRAAGATVLLGTGVDVRDSPVVRRTRPRVAVLNAHVWSIARRHDAHVLDLWGMRSLRDWRMWADDRIHLTTDGHRRVAQAALVALGLEPDEPSWDDPLAPLPPLPRAARVRQDAEWLRTHVYPWATRRLRGRSSGDLRVAKQLDLAPVGAPRVR